MPFSIPDFGARGVELFLLLSGFLLTYNYYDKVQFSDVKSCARFAIQHIRKFWVLHIITFIFMAFLQVKDIWAAGGDSQILKLIPNMLANILLLQSWIPYQEVYWAFNGVSWFLSTLLFCHFMFPIILKLIKRLNDCRALVVWLCVLLLLINLFQTVYTVYAPNSGYVFHIFPLYKVVEFFAGALLGAVYKQTREYLQVTMQNKAWIIVFALGIYLFAIIMCNAFWNRATFVAMTTLFLYITSSGSDQCLPFLSCKAIKAIGSISFEFYLIHHVVIIYYGRYRGLFLNGITLSWEADIFIMFLLSLGLSFAYKKVVTGIRQISSRTA